MYIDTSKLPGNSNTEKAAKKREIRKSDDDVTPKRTGVAKGHIRKRSSMGIRLTDVFVAKDLGMLADHVWDNVVLPKVQNLIVDVIDSVARGIFLGETYVVSRKGTGSVGHTSYDNMFVKNAPSSQIKATSIVKQRGSNSKFETIEFDTFGEAQAVLDQLEAILEGAGVVTVADLYNEADITCPFTGNDNGWYDISSAKIASDGNVYWIKLPKPQPIRD